MTRYVKLLCMLLMVAVLMTGVKMLVVSAQTKDASKQSTIVTVMEEDSQDDTSDDLDSQT